MVSVVVGCCRCCDSRGRVGLGGSNLMSSSIISSFASRTIPSIVEASSVAGAMLGEGDVLVALGL